MNYRNDINARKFFCKVCSVPINVYDDPYFTERLTTIGKVKEFNAFLNEIEGFPRFENFSCYYNEMKQNAIDAIKSNVSYQIFDNSVSMPTEQWNKTPYTEEGGLFISIDMKQANFSALKKFDPYIFNYAKNWEEFISNFTNMNTLINSKYVRQVIMGALNPRKQVAWESHLMSQIVYNLLNAGIDVYSFAGDEILIKVDDHSPNFSMRDLRRIVSKVDFSDDVSISLYDIELLPSGNGYLRTNQITGEMELKCVHIDDYIVEYKKIHDMVITDRDRVFMYNGKLAQYISEVA